MILLLFRLRLNAPGYITQFLISSKYYDVAHLQCHSNSTPSPPHNERLLAFKTTCESGTLHTSGPQFDPSNSIYLPRNASKEFHQKRLSGPTSRTPTTSHIGIFLSPFVTRFFWLPYLQPGSKETHRFNILIPHRVPELTAIVLTHPFIFHPHILDDPPPETIHSTFSDNPPYSLESFRPFLIHLSASSIL